MGKIKIGVQLYSLRKYIVDARSAAETFRRVKALGAEVVQVSGGAVLPAAVIKKISEDNALPICVTHSPFHRIINDLDRLAAEHLEFGCSEIGIGMMPKAYRTGKADDVLRFADVLNDIAKRLAPKNVSIAYHNHGFEFKKDKGNLLFDLLIDNTAPEVRFIPDTFWIKAGGYDPEYYIKRLAKRVQTMHLKDYKKTFCLPIFRAIGKGELDFAAILNKAEEAEVKNAVIELDLSPNPYKSIEFSMNYINKLYPFKK